MKLKRSICILVAMVMALTMSTSMAFGVDVEAEGYDDEISTQSLEGNDAIEEIEEMEEIEEPLILPKDLEVEATYERNSVTLTWSKTEEENVVYEVLQDSLKVENPYVVEGEGDTVSVTINGLPYDQDYEFTVNIKDEMDETILYSGTVAVRISMPKLTLKAAADYIGVSLSWDAVEGATGYNVYRTLSGSNQWKMVATGIKNTKYVHSEKGYTYFVDRTGAKRVICMDCNSSGNKLIDYRVEAVDETATTIAKGEVYKKQPVRPMRIKVTTKVKKSLKSHDGKKGKTTIAKGASLYAIGYSAGKYIFYKNGYRFRVNRISCKNQKADYLSTNGAAWYSKMGSRDYTEEEATNFVNSYSKQKKIGSKTSKFIWASFYTQHLYIFTKKSGKWVLVKQHEIASGKAKAPTPTGSSASGHKSITKKLKMRNGTKYWNCFSGYNALHGMPKKAKGKLGTPASSGCIRNTDAMAKYIRDYCAKGTRLLIY